MAWNPPASRSSTPGVNKLHRFALHGALAVWRGPLVLVANLAFVGPREAFLGECRAQTVAAQALEAVAIVSWMVTSACSEKAAMNAERTPGRRLE